ncbi:tRNA (cytidine(34)-2'-O)-methyltransferase [Pseudemcibacter aquimaris]|uniref:tRNA (cytidine(34)-2'-O)-methyltransferase n=1 Tax=Pseudemcibacter aquimaris TaxID=2857064 RepID=UPI0020120370|nr:tRNA (cytidine(34)-2'-O)-methyltransferase [Pseudemcibacter aquimaris]MCC3861149.1 tRNA (cytidine(34)-2'-O)-methyltransferase [Pseudemcibacter aquimaris]WDU59966.1 tRNA (cytidine(34)-2'-O)-methyltransferase [Pseudemcibacter aquimaris]
MHIALYQPDIPPNTGTIIRMAACLDVMVHIIEPCGFPFGEKSFRRAGMDYIDQSKITRHQSWETFLDWVGERRIALLTTKAAEPYTEFKFLDEDILLLGRESAGVPDDVHERADARLLIPMTPETRSLNIAVSAAMVLGEALRQTSTFPA